MKSRHVALLLVSVLVIAALGVIVYEEFGGSYGCVGTCGGVPYLSSTYCSLSYNTCSLSLSGYTNTDMKLSAVSCTFTVNGTNTAGFVSDTFPATSGTSQNVTLEYGTTVIYCGFAGSPVSGQQAAGSITLSDGEALQFSSMWQQGAQTTA